MKIKWEEMLITITVAICVLMLLGQVKGCNDAISYQHKLCVDAYTHCVEHNPSEATCGRTLRDCKR